MSKTQEKKIETDAWEIEKMNTNFRITVSMSKELKDEIENLVRTRN